MEKEFKNKDCQRPYEVPETMMYKFEIKSCLMVASNPSYTPGTETETGGLEFIYD